MSFLEKNLAVMRWFSPATAELLAAAAVPDGFMLTAGTDGTPTFLRTHADQLEWLGGTSMPAASAGPLVSGLEPGTANGLGLSIGTGYEWLALLKRLPPAQALYVYELDAGLLKMALTICDLAEPLEQLRLVLLGGSAESAGKELETFLRGALGHEPPTVLHPLPTLTMERRNMLLAAGETIVRHAVHSRQALLNEIAGEMAQFTEEKSESVAMLVTPRYPTERPLHEALDVATPRVYLDKHSTASLAWRARTLVTLRPRMVVSDFFRPDLGCVPDAVAVETWIPPLVGPGFWQPGKRVPEPSLLRPHDRIVVHAQVHRVLLESLGIPQRHIELRPLPLAAGGEPDCAARVGELRVALIADLPRADAASLGLNLPTHQSVHAAAVALITDDYLNVSFNNAADILRRALLKAGVSASAAVSDPGLSEPMLRVIRDVLIPTIPLLTLARNLIGQRIAVELIGDWPGMEGETSDLCRFTSFSQAGGGWANIDAVVHLSPWGIVAPLVLQAAGEGIPLIAPRHPSDAFAGALPTLLPENENLLRPQAGQLFATIKGVLRKRASHAP